MIHYLFGFRPYEKGVDHTNRFKRRHVKAKSRRAALSKVSGYAGLAISSQGDKNITSLPTQAATMPSPDLNTAEDLSKYLRD